jgi:hypothetical protein
MAMQTYVFYQKSKEPSLEQLQTAIKEAGFDYDLPESFNINIAEPTFIEGKFEALESCFDFQQDKYNSDDWEWDEADLKVLGRPEVFSVFNTYSNAQEITGMLVVSSVLTNITGGAMLSEFFVDDLLTNANCIEIAKDIIENSREQFNGPSKMRG